jgi:hypothetical protein
MEGLELWMSQFLREEVIQYLDYSFKELKCIIEYIFETDFSNWDKLMQTETKKKNELENITCNLGEEIKRLNEKLNKLVLKNEGRLKMEEKILKLEEENSNIKNKFSIKQSENFNLVEKFD